MKVDRPSFSDRPLTPRAGRIAPDTLGVRMAVDTLHVAAVKPVVALVASAPDGAAFNEVVSEQGTKVSAVRSSAHAPLAAKGLIETAKVVRAAPAPGLAPTAPSGPKGSFARSGLVALDLGAGLYQTATGISELRVGNKRDGLVNLTGGAAFTGSSLLYLAGAPVLGPLAAAAACLLPGVNEWLHGRQQQDRRRQLHGAALIAGGLGFGAIAGLTLAGVGAGATVLGAPVLLCLNAGVYALLIGRGVLGNLDTIKSLSGRLLKRLGF